MRKRISWCLFFLCLLGCTGCMNWTGQKDKSEGKETIGKASKETNEDMNPSSKDENGQKEEEQILVITYGDSLLTGLAQTICDSMGASCYNLSDGDGNHSNETLKELVEESDLILIGTEKEILELEFALRNRLAAEDLADKKTALFLIDREEDSKLYEEKMRECYPDAELLSAFTMNTKENLQDELGRMNGWLTSVLTYGKIPE